MNNDNPTHEVVIERYSDNWEGNHISETFYKNTKIDSDCTAISFFNTGNTLVTVLNVPITAGDSFTFGGEKDIRIKTFFSIAFDSSVLEIGEKANNSCVVIKTYISKVK